jgi:hypothetical protein|tara:strand:- start:85 stop:294 length:210 start_codon:yes stop_codon:yes gene_type:complete
MITEEMIKERISVINGDIDKITKDISDAEKKKTESIGLLNALTGAKQQCLSFLKQFSNDDQPTGQGDVE